MEDIIYKVAYGERRRILLTLYKKGATSLNKLRDILGISPSALLMDISALETLGLIRRDGNLVELTDQGAKVASLLSSIGPLRSLSILEVLGLRPIVVPMLFSPYADLLSALLPLLWAASILNSKLTLLGVIYTNIFENIIEIVLISMISFIGILISIYLISRRRIKITHIIIGLFPILIYPSFYQIIGNFNINYALKFILLVLSCGTLSVITSYDLGSRYETSLLFYLSFMFVLPILAYLFFHVYI